MRANTSSLLLRFTASCPDIPGTLRRSLLGGICGARSLKLLHTLDKLLGAGVLRSFGKAHLIHLLFEKAGNCSEGLLARIFLPCLWSRGWKRGHLPALSVGCLRHVSLLQ